MRTFFFKLCLANFFLCLASLSSAAELGSWLIHEICIQEYLAIQHVQHRQKQFAVKSIEQERQLAFWAYEQAQTLNEKVSSPVITEKKTTGTASLLKDQQFMSFYRKQRQFPMRLEVYQAKMHPDQSQISQVQAVLAMKERRYSFVLKTLMQLMKRDPTWGILYNKVQRIYSINERGAGQAALSW